MKVFGLKFLTFQLVALFVALGVQVSTGEAQGDVPKIVGAWKLNHAKSKFDPSSVPPKSLTVRFEWDGERLKLTRDEVNEKGEQVVSVRFIAKYDGKSYSIPGREHHSTRLTKIDDYTSEVTSKDEGRDAITFRHVVAKDGKTMTITHANTIRVFDRE